MTVLLQKRGKLLLLIAVIIISISMIMYKPATVPTQPLMQTPLSITAESGRNYVFTVEVARTEDEQEFGLMNRTHLDQDRGMLFPFSEPQEAVMWMKNTKIPLDMVFIRTDNTISNIAENTEPMSLKHIPSEGPVKAVLELPGGTAKRLGFKAGDKVDYELEK